jgi:hypothetical protein
MYACLLAQNLCKCMLYKRGAFHAKYTLASSRCNLNHDAGFISRQGGGNRIQFHPRRWDVCVLYVREERIFARMTAKLLYANAGGEWLSNNFTVARCT